MGAKKVSPKTKNKDPVIPYTETQDDGTEVFVYGKNRIIVSKVLPIMAKPWKI